jgi:hypothetical protein
VGLVGLVLGLLEALLEFGVWPADKFEDEAPPQAVVATVAKMTNAI